MTYINTGKNIWQFNEAWGNPQLPERTTLLKSIASKVRFPDANCITIIEHNTVLIFC